MSTAAYSRSSTATSAASSQRKFCGVCHKKGLPESVYTSHFTKSVPGDKGIVTCPTILNAVCSFCKGKGHWADIKFCSAMRSQAKNNRRDTNTVVDADGFSQKVVRPRAPAAAAPADARPSKNVTLYGCLNDSDNDSDNDETPSLVNERVPAIVKPVAAALPTPGVSWASMASRPPVVREEPEYKPLAEGFVVLGRRSDPVTLTESVMAVREREDLANAIICERNETIDWEGEDAAIFGYYDEEEDFDDHYYQPASSKYADNGDDFW